MAARKASQGNTALAATIILSDRPRVSISCFLLVAMYTGLVTEGKMEIPGEGSLRGGLGEWFRLMEIHHGMRRPPGAARR